ncbi:MAG: hypothetical protein A2X17_02455 [Bacteroidetes bacterium GWF2_41_61]|nr:MAG: hypothetical protein A2X20_09530 [Bacteroidetes bacterium GWE2_40_15]OFY27591.1 MAG: hypothetical protein A2X17_02455 [Bacteroidetes bacterium GWF2_41_61]OFY91084.1 MAG: hypothetical protein A2266_00300 [Bacteroidetes bacterium RIFOXYA12_FULL_40_10]HBG25076.1 hypothetical protein [Rikenellaceae bacterium]HBZ24835.1 hypothetical protein [Rikenellaceae bacterium]
MAKKNWMNEILGGQILLHSGILQQARYVLFIFVLVIIYISINFGMERSLLIERKNQRELRHLKSDYTSKASRLQYQSKRAEVEKRLLDLGSTIKAPVNPPKRVIIGE